MAKIFRVGGCVRDKMLGVETNDIDFTFVLDDLSGTPEQGFTGMDAFLKKEGYEVFLRTPDCFTIRAKFPKDHKFAGLVADFVMARKEVGYEEGTRKPLLVLGTLEDDLIRRDFTLNAMAEDENGTIIDLFEGAKHLKEGILVTPRDPVVTFMDDPLRMLRALRFSVTKGFTIAEPVWEAMFQEGLIERLRTTVSQERIREEMNKAFKVNTLATIRLLHVIDAREPKLTEVIFDNGLWLQPTFKNNK